MVLDPKEEDILRAILAELRAIREALKFPVHHSLTVCSACDQAEELSKPIIEHREE